MQNQSIKYRASNFAMIPVNRDISLANRGIVLEKDRIPLSKASGAYPMAPSRKLFLQALLACLYCLLGYKPASAEAAAQLRSNAGRTHPKPFFHPRILVRALARSRGLFENRGP